MKKIRIKKTVGSGYNINLKELPGFMKELAVF
jgi:hypothetical protein